MILVRVEEGAWEGWRCEALDEFLERIRLDAWNVEQVLVGPILPRDTHRMNRMTSRAELKRPARVASSIEEGDAMRQTGGNEQMRAWAVDYSEARAKAIARLGDRYLLARPIRRRDATGRC